MLNMNPQGKLNRVGKPTTENIISVQQEISLCTHGKLHQLTDRNGKYIST